MIPLRIGDIKLAQDTPEREKNAEIRCFFWAIYVTTTPAAPMETLLRLRQVMVKTTFDQSGDSGIRMPATLTVTYTAIVHCMIETRTVFDLARS